MLDAVTAGGRAVRYVPLDVDRLTLEASAERLLRDYPSLRVHALVGDFERDLSHVPPPTGRRLAMFLGSTIGNLDEPAQRRLLADLRALLPDPRDRLLLGVDLVKDVKILEAAYDDSAGVTRDFNLNILKVINHGVDGDFDPEAFRHRAFYNDAASRIEMHLVADSAQTVRLRRLGLTVRFRPGEGIWTESSYKFTRAGVEALLARRGPAARPLARGPRQLLRARPDPARLMAEDGGAYAQPTPRTLYVHDDLRDEVAAAEGAASPAAALARELLALLAADRERRARAHARRAGGAGRGPGPPRAASR